MKINSIIKEDDGGTCSSSIAAAPAQNLFAEPQKRVKETAPQTIGTALKNTLSKVEPGSKLDKKIKHHNDMVRRFGTEAGTMSSAPRGYHIKKNGLIALGEGATSAPKGSSALQKAGKKAVDNIKKKDKVCPECGGNGAGGAHEEDCSRNPDNKKVDESADSKTHGEIFNRIANTHTKGLDWKKEREVVSKARDASHKAAVAQGRHHVAPAGKTDKFGRNEWGESVNRTVNVVNESRDCLVAKFTKDGKTYHLWNDGNYLYNLTRTIDGVPKHVHHWPQAELEQVKAEMERKGYNEVGLQEAPMKPVRSYKAGGPDDPAVKAKARSADKYAKSKEARLADLRTEPITVYAEDIERLAAESGVGLGGRVEDFTSERHGTLNKDGVRVSAVKITVYVDVDLVNDLGYDQQTIDQMYNGEAHTMESFNALIYRDPQNPKQLRMSQ